MLLALISDIHANREALSACLAHAHTMGAERYIFVGDYVGYGADPGWVVDRIREYVSAGAIAIRGNHDEAVLSADASMHETARAAIAWTRDHLTPAQCDFLRRLPLTAEEDDRLYVHASAHAPAAWEYVTSTEAVRRSFLATTRRITICGHTHVPELHYFSATGKLGDFTPAAGVSIPLSPQRRWLVVLGSVGQPRDGIAAASYALLNDRDNMLTFMRVPYDTATAAAKIVEAGLPEVLSHRLLSGR